MSELSQDEIDAMLNGGGDDPPPKKAAPKKDGDASDAASSQDAEGDADLPEGVVHFDFMRPNRFPKEQKKTLRLIHETFAHSLGLSLSASLNLEVSIEFESVEQLSFQEYTNTLITPTCIFVYDIHPLGGVGILEINATFAYAIIDKMLGGEGVVPPIGRAFTDLERAIMQKLSLTVLRELESSWSHIINLKFHLTEIQTNPSFIRCFPLREVCIVITLRAKLGDTTSLITLCVPYASLEPISSKLGNDQWHSRYSSRKSEEVQKAHKRNFSKIELALQAILGEIDIPMLDLLLLKRGDILNLEHKTTKPLSIRVGGIEKFKASPGLVGKHKGVAITKEIVKET